MSFAEFLLRAVTFGVQDLYAEGHGLPRKAEEGFLTHAEAAAHTGIHLAPARIHAD